MGRGTEASAILLPTEAAAKKETHRSVTEPDLHNEKWTEAHSRTRTKQLCKSYTGGTRTVNGTHTVNVLAHARR